MHPDGTNYTAYTYVRAGGGIGPGLGVIVAQTFGTTAPPIVLIQGTGPPAVPNLLGNATGAAAGLFAGYALGHDNEDTTVVVPNPPAAPMMHPPTPTPPTPVHPPNGRPPSNRPPNRPK